MTSHNIGDAQHRLICGVPSGGSSPQGEERIGGSDAGKYFTFRDHLGSFCKMTDASGTVRARFAYDFYGSRTQIEGDLSCEIGFTGHPVHEPTQLVLAPFRAYDPATARWLSRDPLGEMADGPNLYSYVLNNPMNLWDPYGLLSFNDVSDFAAGWGDTLTTIPFTDFSLTREFRNSLPGIYGDNGGVDRCSSSYGAGEWAGIGNSLALGGKGVGNLASRIGNQSTRSKLYEIGQRTLSGSEYGRYSHISDPVRRGIAMVRGGSSGGISPRGLLTQSHKTVPTGLTPQAAAARGDLGAAFGGTLVGGTGIFNQATNAGGCP